MFPKGEAIKKKVLMGVNTVRGASEELGSDFGWEGG